MRIKNWLTFCSLILMAWANAVHAADTLPGDACTTANQVMTTGGAESGGTRDFLICNGTTWQSTMRMSSGGLVGVGTGTATPAAKLDVNGGARIGYNSGTCTSSNNGEIRYNSASPAWTYCNGSAWTPFSSASSSGLCPNIGDVCSDGSIYIGLSPYNGARMYTTRCTYSRTYSGGACTSDPTNVTWDDGNGNATYADIYGIHDGRFNTYALQEIDSNSSAAGTQNHNAAKTCYDLSMHGKTDWYLPAIAEGNLLRTSSGLIFDTFSDGYPYDLYWESNQGGDQYGADQISFKYSEGQTGNPKPNGALVRCVRRDDSTTEVAPTGCTTAGATCSDGTEYVGSPLFSIDKLYVTTADNSTASKWSTETVTTEASADTNGRENTFWIKNNKTIANYPAFQVCATLTANGHSDWFLPGINELSVMYTNRTAIGGFTTGVYWSSYENTSTKGNALNFSSGAVTTPSKSTNERVRCVRRAELVN